MTDKSPPLHELFTIPSPVAPDRSYLAATKRKASDIKSGHAGLSSPIGSRPWTAREVLSRGMQTTLRTNTSNLCLTTISSLEPEVKSHLEETFWKLPNTYLPLVRRDQIAKYREAYSSLLHLAVLASGFRYSVQHEGTDSDPKLGCQGSTLHQTLRDAIDGYTPFPDDLEAIQSMVLLSDLEHGSGRYTSAGAYLRNAQQFAIMALGDPLQHGLALLADEDILLQRAILKACHFLDLQWRLLSPSSMILSAPNGNKYGDRAIEISRSSIWKVPNRGEENVLAFHALLGLLELTVAIRYVEIDRKISDDPTSSYMQLRRLAIDLNQYLNNLPDQLRWTEQMWRTATPVRFILQQQIYINFFLIYSHLAISLKNGSSQHQGPAARGALITYRQKSTQCVVLLQELLTHFQERFRDQPVPAIAVQQLGLVIDEVLSDMAMFQDTNRKRSTILSCLKYCVTILNNMCCTHKIAEQIKFQAAAHLSAIEQDLINTNPGSSNQSNDTALAPNQVLSRPSPINRTNVTWAARPPVQRDARRPSLATARTQACSTEKQIHSPKRPNKELTRSSEAEFAEDPVFSAYAKEMSSWSDRGPQLEAAPASQRAAIGRSTTRSPSIELEFELDWLTQTRNYPGITVGSPRQQRDSPNNRTATTPHLGVVLDHFRPQSGAASVRSHNSPAAGSPSSPSQGLIGPPSRLSGSLPMNDENQEGGIDWNIINDFEYWIDMPCSSITPLAYQDYTL